MFWFNPAETIFAAEKKQDKSIISEEIVIEATGPRSDADPTTTSSALTVIEVDQRVNSTESIAEAFTLVPGATVHQLGGLGDWSAVSIRGSSLRQVLVYLDEIPLNPDGIDAVNLSELPLQAFSRLEIYRSNAPIRFGAAPLGGVINLVTPLNQELIHNAGTSFGSYNSAKSNLFLLEPLPSFPMASQAFLYVDLFHTDGNYRYFFDNGTAYNWIDDHIKVRANNDKTQFQVLGRISSQNASIHLTMLDSFIFRDEGVPGHVNNPTLDSRLQTLRNLAAFSATQGHLRRSFRFKLYHHDRSEWLDDRSGELNSSPEITRSHFWSSGLSLHVQKVISPRIEWAGNGEIHRDAFAGRLLLADSVLTPQSRRVAGLALNVGILTLSDRVLWTATALVQAFNSQANTAYAWTSSGGGSGWRFPVAPRSGVLIRPAHSPVTIKANAGRYLRMPDMTELFGNRGVSIGNSALRPEVGWQSDVGMSYDHAPRDGWTWRWEGSVFWNDVQDLIIWLQNSQRILYPVNLGKARIVGVEGAGEVSVGNLELSLTGTWTHAQNLEPDPAYYGNQLPRIPKLELNQNSLIRLGSLLLLGYDLSFTDGNYWDKTNWYRAAPRMIQGASVRLNGRFPWPNVEINARNITNKMVEVVPQNPLQLEHSEAVVQNITDFVGYPLAGRTVLITLRWNDLP